MVDDDHQYEDIPWNFLSILSYNVRSASEKYKSLLVIIEKLYIAVVELGFSPTDGKYDTIVELDEVFFALLWIELQRTLLEMSFRVMPFDRFVMAIDQNILTLTEEFVKRVILGRRTPRTSLENYSIFAFRIRQRSEILHHQRATNSYVTK